MELGRVKCPFCGSEIIIDKEPTEQYTTKKPFVVCKNRKETIIYAKHNEKEKRRLQIEKFSVCNACILLKKVGDTYEIDEETLR